MGPAGRTLAIAAALSVALAAACGGTPTRPGDVPLGQPFELRAGASAVLPGDLTITFDRVQSDSRCPIDAVCVRAGEAIIVVLLKTGSSGRDERELRTDATGSEIVYRDYTIRLVTLAPYPRASTPTRPEDYVATFVVRAR